MPGEISSSISGNTFSSAVLATYRTKVAGLDKDGATKTNPAIVDIASTTVRWYSDITILSGMRITFQ